MTSWYMLLPLAALLGPSGCTFSTSLGSCSEEEPPPPALPTDFDRDHYEAESAGGTDCDDEDEFVNPGMSEEGPRDEEVCTDTKDNDCDGLWDADDPGCVVTPVDTADTAWSLDDADGDGTTEAEGDCDDSDGAISPRAADRPGDELDSNCDGQEYCFVDADEDGYRVGDGTATVLSLNIDCQEIGEALEDEPVGDCDDAREDVSPAHAEVCDDLDADEDCDGPSDDEDTSATGQTEWFADRDEDTYGDNYTREERCDAREHFIADNRDCDDTDGSVTLPPQWAPDADGDGWGDDDPSIWITQCFQRPGYTSQAQALDCDDTSSAWNPGVSDACMDGNDQDCSGSADDDAWSWWDTIYAYAGHDDEYGGSDPIYLATGDLDGSDGMDLVAVGEWSGRVYAFMNDGSGGFYLDSTQTIGLTARSAATGAINARGRDSVLAVNPDDDTVTTLYLTSSGLNDMATVALPSGDARAAALLDLDVDGRSETALVGDNDTCSVHFYAVAESGALSYVGTNELATGCASSDTGPVQLHTVEGDSTTYIFSANASMDSFSLFAWGDSGWSLEGTWYNSSMGLTSELDRVVSITTGDFGGGALDVAMVSLDSSYLVLGNSSTLYTSATTIDLGSGTQPESVVAADYNGDGVDDLAVALSATDQVYVYVQTGDFSFSRRATLTVGDDPRELATEDFDRDGDIDLAVINYGDDALTLLKNNCIP